MSGDSDVRRRFGCGDGDIDLRRLAFRRIITDGGYAAAGVIPVDVQMFPACARAGGTPRNWFIGALLRDLPMKNQYRHAIFPVGFCHPGNDLFGDRVSSRVSPAGHCLGLFRRKIDDPVFSLFYKKRVTMLIVFAVFKKRIGSAKNPAVEISTDWPLGKDLGKTFVTISAAACPVQIECGPDSGQ